MYAKGKNKATKGTVQIKTSNGRLQMVFSYPIVAEDGEIKNKRFYFSTGQKDSPLGYGASFKTSTLLKWW